MSRLTDLLSQAEDQALSDEAVTLLTQAQLTTCASDRVRLDDELADVVAEFLAYRQAHPDVVDPDPDPDPDPVDDDPPGWDTIHLTDFDSLDDWGIEDGTSTRKGTPWPLANNQTQGNDNSVNMARNVSTSPERGLVGVGRRESGLSRPFSSFELLGDTAPLHLPNSHRVEVIGTFQDLVGVWPCLLWERPVGAGDGEIDVMEWMGGLWAEAQKRVAITMHNEYGATQDSIKKPMRTNVNPWFVPNAQHRYTMEKVPGSIKVWIDGRLVASFGPADKSWWARFMEQPKRLWYPRITLQIGQGSATKVVPNPEASFQSTEVTVRSYRAWRQL